MANIIENILNGLKQRAKGVTFTIVFPNKESVKVGDGNDNFTIKINKKEVYSQAFLKGTLGIAEQYMLENLEIEGDLVLALTTLLTSNIDVSPKNSILAFFEIFKKKIFLNNRHRALRNIKNHYDLGNEFFKSWLGPTMQYSSAYFFTGDEELDVAETNKLELICKKLNLKKGEALLDIGCGWGGLIIYAAKKYGVKGTGISISKEQIKYAREEAKKEGVENLVQFEELDYRDIHGKFDKIVSVEMLDHVGKAFFDDYFGNVKNNLKPGGLFLVTINGFDYSYKPDPFFEKYIFPGGEIAFPYEVIKMGTKFGLVPWDLENITKHQGLTIERWRKNFLKDFDIHVKHYGKEFGRMWNLYLSTAEAFYKTGHAKDYHFLFVNGFSNQLPLEKWF